jgi:two-component system, NtrC family, sensor kinase
MEIALHNLRAVAARSALKAVNAMNTKPKLLENVRLLLVDDESVLLKNLSRLTERAGAVTHLAENAEEAMTILDTTPIDVSVLDVRMPGMDGITLLKEIKKQWPDLEVILMTGHANPQDGVEGIKAGAFDYLCKPLEIDHLLSKIKQAHERIFMREESRRQAELKERMEKEIAASRRLASLGTMIAGVAHEINNPLAIIKEGTDWLRMLLKREQMADMPLKGEFERVLGMIEGGLTRASRITHDLLGTVKRQSPAFHDADALGLIREVMDSFTREAQSRGIFLNVVCRESAIPVKTSVHQLRQVLTNILSNALHATPIGGQVTVTAERRSDSVEITVQDGGNGIAPENLEKVFEPFFTTKSPGQGTGLGLFLARSMVEKMGGTISVSSRLGHGAAFCVRLPLHVQPKGAFPESN